jgi:hypothetical protein
MNDFNNIQMVHQPEKLKISLYNHQLASIYNMEKLESNNILTSNTNEFKETKIGVNSDIAGFGKCHAIDTKILMYDGTIKLVQDIEIGDLLMGDDSKPREVLSLARGRDEMYDIIQNINEKYTVNKEHILCLKSDKYPYIENDTIGQTYIVHLIENNKFVLKTFKYDENTKNNIENQVTTFFNNIRKDSVIEISVRDYLKLNYSQQNSLKGYRSYVNFPEKSVEIEPYMLGYWLGNKSYSNLNNDNVIDYFKICTDINKLLIKKKTIKYKIKKYIKYLTNGGPEMSFSEIFIGNLKKLNILYNKHIPHVYKCNSRENRLKLLAGLLDSEGYLVENSIYKFSSNNIRLVDDIVYLARSLGFNCNKKLIYQISPTENKDNVYTLSIYGKNLDIIPTTIFKEKINNSKYNNNNLLYNINIKYNSNNDYYGFTLNGNNRYLLGDFTVTHNTLSMIGLMIRDKMEWDTDIPFVFEKIKIQAHGRVKSYEICRHNKIPSNLILMSQSIIGQWESELSHTDLKYISIKNKQDLTDIQAEDYDAVLVIPTMYNKLVTLYGHCAWKRFIFDEPGNLKVPGMLDVYAGFYWFLTATPMQIFFHHYRCKNTFMQKIIGTSYSEFENLFKDIIIKNDPDFIKASFEIPKTYHHYHQCYQPIYNIICNFVNDNIKNMIEIGNIEGAIIALGGNKTSNIVDVILEKKKNELAELEVKIQIYRLRQDDNKILEMEDKKNRINNQINDLDNKYKDMLKTPCNICCEQLKNPVLEFNCQNIFCGECLLKWLRKKNSCPLCRVEVNPKQLTYIKTEDSIDTTFICNESKNMSKVEKIIDIIQKNKEGKFLIFSDHDGSFSAINKVLKENNISCVQIRGNIKTTEKNLHSFKYGDTSVIFLNSKFNGAGINLQEATDIILYHEMHFNIETQILGRANRIGRKIPLNVHHLQIKS